MFASPPAVQVLEVGRGASILEAAVVRARSATLGVGRRHCAVGAATPLATLLAARRAGGPGFRVRDYGACSRSPRDAGGLFVFAVGHDRNSGRDGWEYKVNGRAGSTGAADPNGPFGDGRRLRSGDEVLWFWCRADAAGHCQRTLAVTTTPTVDHGATLRVDVQGYDDAGRAQPVSGATVTLGGASATSGPNGVATLVAPRPPGTYRVNASAPGLVPAFPIGVSVT
jgi:hypothetical protein